MEIFELKFDESFIAGPELKPGFTDSHRYSCRKDGCRTSPALEEKAVQQKAESAALKPLTKSIGIVKLKK